MRICRNAQGVRAHLSKKGSKVLF